MIYSRSAEYAIRALARLARREPGRNGHPPCVMSRQIAEDAGIPAQFLAKLLQQLTRRGLLKSVKGPAGGFSLARPAREIGLLRIVDAVDGLEAFSRCPFAGGECQEEAPCGMHDRWCALRSRIMDYLERTSVEDLARGLASHSQTGRPIRKGVRRPPSRR